MKNYYIANTEPSTYWKEFYNDSTGWKKYKRIHKNTFIKEYLYRKYDGICQFCNKPLKDTFVVHHTTYNRECTFDPAKYGMVQDDEITFCEECNKKSQDNFDRCISLLRPVCVFCNRRLEGIARRLPVPSEECIPESHPGYYFMKDEIKRLNQLLEWAALSNKCEFPKTEKLQNMYEAFSKYNYEADIYRIWNRTKKPIKPKPKDIIIDNADMKLLFELTTWAVTKLGLKDEAFVNFYKRLNMINRTSEYYGFTSLENPMDDQGKLRKK